VATKQHKKTVECRPLLTIKVSGPGVHTGRISVPDLLVVCQQVQSAVNRQAEAIEGKQTLRPGPKLGKVHEECTLELVSLGGGSALLGFDPAKSQQSLPYMATLGEQAVVRVSEAVRALSHDEPLEIDPGVLDSLRNMGELLNNGVRSIKLIMPARPGRKRIEATYNLKAQERVVRRLRPPEMHPVVIDGVLEMADFGSTERCRVHPALGPSISCTFSRDLADDVYAALRQAAHIEGKATINAQTGKMESIAITRLIPLDPLALNAGNFLRGWTLEQLVQTQDVGPLTDPKLLAGGWPEDEDVDDVLGEIYQRRH
jgi:hypothetical protein